jgi:hypothetical protein
VYTYGRAVGNSMVRMRIGTVYDTVVPMSVPPRTGTYVSFPPWIADPLGWHAVTCSSEAVDYDPGNNVVHDSVNVDTLGGIEGERESSRAFRFDGPRPMPVRSRAELVFSLPAPCRVELAVYSTDGRLVRTLVSGDLRPGNHRAVWDCEDNSGRVVGSGIYYTRLVAGEKTATRKLVKQD